MPTICNIKVAVLSQSYDVIISEVNPILLEKIISQIKLGEDFSHITENNQLYYIEKNNVDDKILIKINEVQNDSFSFELFQLFLSAFEQSYDGVIITDAHGKVVYLNKNYTKALQINLDDFIGKHVTEIISNSRMHVVAKTKKPEIGVVFELRGKPIIVSRYPLFKNEKLIGTLGLIMFRKTVELKKIIQRMQDMEKKLKYFQDNVQQTLQAKYSFKDIITQSSVMKKLIEKSKKIAITDSNIIITGESGTGKELLAHAIHKESFRKNGPFVKVNCGAIPAELFESELFGYAEGAFTGAKKGGKLGKFQLADHGTLFLDEIGEMPLHMQVKLLRVIQEREIDLIGSSAPIPIDIRIIAATNTNLSKLVDLGKFRRDLFYRLSVFLIYSYPLRERKDDILLLATSFSKIISEKLDYGEIVFDQNVLDILYQYFWPGNIRELRNVIEQAIGLMEENIITVETLPTYLNNSNHKFNQSDFFDANIPQYKESIMKLEKKLILSALKHTNGEKKKAALVLGIARSLLYNKLKELNIDEALIQSVSNNKA